MSNLKPPTNRPTWQVWLPVFLPCLAVMIGLANISFAGFSEVDQVQAAFSWIVSGVAMVAWARGGGRKG